MAKHVLVILSDGSVVKNAWPEVIELDHLKLTTPDDVRFFGKSDWTHAEVNNLDIYWVNTKPGLEVLR